MNLGMEAAAGHTAFRDSGRAFLFGEEQEEEGYGLYSYLLLPSRPGSDRVRERYLAVIVACLRYMEDVATLEDHITNRSQLNVVYLLLQVKASNEAIDGRLIPLSEWILDNYNYARARAYLACTKFRGAGPDSGPYFVSCSTRLNHAGDLRPPDSRRLYQDLTEAHASVASMWVRLFLRQARKVTFWEPDLFELWVVKLRNAVAVAAEATDVSTASLDEWVQLMKKWIWYSS